MRVGIFGAQRKVASTHQILAMSLNRPIVRWGVRGGRVRAHGNKGTSYPRGSFPHSPTSKVSLNTLQLCTVIFSAYILGKHRDARLFFGMWTCVSEISGYARHLGRQAMKTLPRLEAEFGGDRRIYVIE